MPVNPLDEQIKQLQKTLSSSPTAYSYGAKPSASDIAADTALRKLQSKRTTEQGAALRELTYGPDTGEPPPTKPPGYLSKVLKTLNTPLYAVAGATEALLGKGTKKGLANISENVKEQGTFGDILRSYNLPNAVSMPLGFGLDVVADPLNWLTAGTATLVPRVGVGLAKAGLEGAAVGAKSWGLNVLEGAGRLVPGLEKAAFSEAAAAERAAPTFYRILSGKADVAASKYAKLTGHGIEQQLAKEAGKTRIAEKVSRELDKTSFGQKMKELFWYSPGDKLRKKIAEADEAALKRPFGKTSAADDAALRGRSGIDDVMSMHAKDAAPTPLMESIDDGIRVASDPSVARSGSALNVGEDLSDEAIRAAQDKAAIQQNMDHLSTLLHLHDKGALPALAGMTEEQTKNLSDLFTTLKTDIQGWDKYLASALVKNAAFKGTMNGYALILGAFKTAKVPGNIVAAGARSTLGNAVFTSNMGFDISNTGLHKALKWAWDVASGKEGQAYRELFENPENRELLQKYPEIWKWVTGVDANILTRGEDYVREVVAKAADDLRRKGMKSGDAEKLVKSFVDLQKEVEAEVRGAKTAYEAATATKAIKKARARLSSPVEAALQGEESPFFTQEVLVGTFGRWVRSLEKAGENGNLLAKGLHAYFTGPGELYSRFDQAFKLGLFKHMTTGTGLTEAEMAKLIPRFKITANDAVKLPGRNRWTIRPQKALEITNEGYMNYQALPGFVRIMRTLPLVGSPFISFAYGNTALAAKTAAYNLASFNKVQNFVREAGGGRSPLEKQALEGPYYSWMNQPTMAKIPFFKDNPLYLDLTNLIPYYSMSMLTPPSRNYGERFGGKVAEIIDKSPFVKDPFGQMLLDYMVIPQLLGESQGQFGQQLYPAGAGPLQKAGAIGSAALETVVPTAAGAVGAIPNLAPESWLPYMPSYRFRQLQYATKGKTSAGIPAKEDPARRVLRVLASMSGFPVFQAQIRFNDAKQTKK